MSVVSGQLLVMPDSLLARAKRPVFREHETLKYRRAKHAQH